MGFNLKQLSDIYAQQIMPYVRRKTDNVLVRLDVFYAELMRIKFGIGIGEDGAPLKPSSRQEELGREIFGNRVIDLASNEWYYIEACLVAEKMPHQWESYPLHSRAKWMAAKTIDNMVQVISRYRDVIERKNKEALNKLNPPSSPTTKKRR